VGASHRLLAPCTAYAVILGKNHASLDDYFTCH
jgi:hypothetical protein